MYDYCVKKIYDWLGTIGMSFFELLRLTTCSWDTEILLNTQTGCTEIERNIARCRNLNYQLLLLKVDKSWRQWLSAFFLLLCGSAVAAMDELTLSINKHLFYLEVPETRQEYQQGLMFRTYLAADHGMIFFFEPYSLKPAAMWMKNTYLSLDLLFIGTDYKIACLIEHTAPLSLERLFCIHPTVAVIELNAGEIKKNGLVVGIDIMKT